MNYSFKELKENILGIENWLKKEFSNIRTGLASITILDNIRVENYGNVVPLNQVANLKVEDAKTLRIVPWDASQVKEIEKAITRSDLGVAVVVDGKGLRISFPELTNERRHVFVKIAKDKLEQAKVSLRAERDEVWGDIQDKERGGEISEDEKFQLKTEMQKIIDEIGQVLVALFEKKEKEILG